VKLGLSYLSALCVLGHATLTFQGNTKFQNTNFGFIHTQPRKMDDLQRRFDALRGNTDVTQEYLDQRVQKLFGDALAPPPPRMLGPLDDAEELMNQVCVLSCFR
jgi:hypothetical protein